MTKLDEGTQLGNGRYILAGRLGSGGAATVWLADDTVLERSVAVKVLSEALASDANWLARFRREARLAASLTHPNLVSVYDFSADSDPPFLVMAHMPGGSLYDHLQAGEEPDAERLTRDVLAALAAIHATGIIHRDIKPGNVLLAADGTACLTDFGVARPEDATSLTQTGHIPGTARYMAPELWQGHPADERSDLYAMGILLRGTVGDQASPQLLNLIERLADEDSRHRPASARAALAELEPEERTSVLAVAAAPPEDPTPVSPLPIEPRPETTARTITVESDDHPHRRVAFAGLAVLAVVAAIAIAQAVGGGGGDSPSSRSGNGGNSNASAQNSSGNSGEGSTSTEETTTPPEEETTTPSEEPTEPAAASAEEAAALDREANGLILAGDPEGAIPLLERAIAYYPEDSEDIDYAYSLYNLGDALILAGRPDEAISYLKRRLAFTDQRETVEARLAEAREAAGQSSSGEGG